jgi:hypothetical protein
MATTTTIMRPPHTTLSHPPQAEPWEYLPPVDAKAVEQALLIGDLSKMTDGQRIAYYLAICRSMGLNPLTKPFQALRADDGKVVLYPDKGCAEQLRALHRISLRVVSRETVDDLYCVTIRATAPNGREEEAQGIVPLSKAKGTWEDYDYRGEKKRRFKAAADADGQEILVRLSPTERATAMMRAETKAKRRVTLAICGLGLPDAEAMESPQAHPMALNLHTGGLEGEMREPTPPELTARPEEQGKGLGAHIGDLFGDSTEGDVHQQDTTQESREGAKEETVSAKFETLDPKATPETQASGKRNLDAARGLKNDIRDSADFQTLRAYQGDARLPEDVLEQIAAALSPLAPATESEAAVLARQVLDWVTQTEA